jgi:hypothetical protein
MVNGKLSARIGLAMQRYAELNYELADRIRKGNGRECLSEAPRRTGDGPGPS